MMQRWVRQYKSSNGESYHVGCGYVCEGIWEIYAIPVAYTGEAPLPCRPTWLVSLRLSFFKAASNQETVTLPNRGKNENSGQET